jgi:hypothetical protein
VIFATTAVPMLRKGLAVFAVVVIAAGAAYDIKTTPPIYSDGATMVFYITRQMATSPEQENSINQSLVTTEVMFSQTTAAYIETIVGKVQIVAFPCNRFNLEYPDYEEQCATLTATGRGATAADRGLWLAYQVLKSRLMRLQASAAVHPRDRIRTYLVGISGPEPERGSRSRVFAGLGLLTIIGVLTAWRFFELRRPQRRTRRHQRARQRRYRVSRSVK